MMYRNLVRKIHGMPKTNDLIGPPCPRSNLRPIRLTKSYKETPLQEKYRLARLEVHAWNQEFWAAHNTAFTKEREIFIASNRTIEKTTLNAEEMSVFYKSFLDKNWKNHINYNMQWYKRNIFLLILSFRVSVEKIQLKLSSL